MIGAGNFVGLPVTSIISDEQKAKLLKHFEMYVALGSESNTKKHNSKHSRFVNSATQFILSSLCLSQEITKKILEFVVHEAITHSYMDIFDRILQNVSKYTVRFTNRFSNTFQFRIPHIVMSILADLTSSVSLTSENDLQILTFFSKLVPLSEFPDAKGALRKLLIQFSTLTNGILTIH
jgi:hypothetical protein